MHKKDKDIRINSIKKIELSDSQRDGEEFSSEKFHLEDSFLDEEQIHFLIFLLMYTIPIIFLSVKFIFEG